MDNIELSRRISNSYYNHAIDKACIRDLSGAAADLKVCLNLNKYHIDARNLLGLVYYEMGEVSEAVVQWVISTNLSSENNKATEWIDILQSQPEVLDRAEQAIRKYNQALAQANADGDDLAVIQLTRVADANPRFVKANLLLALLYINREEYTRAGKYLVRVQRVDKYNVRAAHYMNIVKAHTGKAEVERKRQRRAFSHNQLQDDDVIIPPTYKENTGLQMVLNIIAGLLLGAAAIFFLVMPARERGMNNAHTKELLLYNEQLNQKNEQIASQQKTVENAKAAEAEAEEALDSLLNNTDSIMNQYSVLVRMMDNYRTGKLIEAVALYPEINTELFTDERVKPIADNVLASINTEGYDMLEARAYEMWAAGRMNEALKYYETCLALRPENPKVILNMGLIFRQQGRYEEAINNFTQIVTIYADTDQAPRARNELIELVGHSAAEIAAAQPAVPVGPEPPAQPAN